ncbi:hypothetical protein ABIB25_001920 [Nakamurella sp. UYEF19]|uniref:CHRD domain-containing protein n=1 Tax=Nakamurella sp. UYEF19 TaxID=1756392 RepID=UPI003397D058
MQLKRTSATLASAAMLAIGAMMFGPAGSASAESQMGEPASFTSAFTAMATPDMVVNAQNVLTPGTAGASGTFNYRINSDLEVICYDISVTGITAPFMSPAKTATHIHQGAPAKAGPPRIAFPNPVQQADGVFVSSGCLQGPFTTGIKNADTGVDTGEGFTLDQIEADPAAFFTDTHTKANPAGAVRGQLTAVPVGGIKTGGGAMAASLSGTGSDDGLNVLPFAAAGVVLLAGAGVVLRRRATN